MEWQSQISDVPVLVGGSYQSETTDPYGLLNRTRSGCAASGCPPGSAGVPPAPHWQGLAHLLHPDRPATGPGLCFDRAHAVVAGRVAGCHIAGKLSVTRRQCMRARRPRSRVALPPITLAARRGAAVCRVPHRRETERHATGVHAGGTPALPGGTSSCYSCRSQGRGGLPGAPSQETERHVAGVHAGGRLALPGGLTSHRSCCSRDGAAVCRGPHPGKLSGT